jgi:hypothetical protein
MSIVFHCEHCGKKIEAQDSAGGKWGKCPSCHNKIYIPALNINDDEELTLAPIDEEEEKRKKQLMAETFMLEQDILKQREEPPEDVNPNFEPSEDVLPYGIDPIRTSELDQSIINYLKLMAEGNLDSAGDLEKHIVASGNDALDILDKIAISDMPEPELQHIPPQVLSGMIRNLRSIITG